MFKIENLACATIVALFPIAQSARAGSDTHPIRILCEDARLAAMCGELAQVLSHTQDSHRVEVTGAETVTETATGAAHLTLRFVIARFTASVLSGRLAWHDAAGRLGTGTEIDLTVMDAPIDDDILREYARQLLRFTRLPL